MSRLTRADHYAILTLWLLPLVVFGDVVLGMTGLFAADLFAYHYPMKNILHHLVWNGEFPWWNPFYAAGSPAAANPAYELFYPGQWPIFLPSFWYGFHLHIFLHFAIAGSGMYLLVRSFLVRPAIALTGAVWFAFSTPYISLLLRLPFLFAYSWFPLVLYFARGAFLTRSRSSIAGAAIALGMVGLIGEPTSFLQLSMLLGVLAVAPDLDKIERPTARRNLTLSVVIVLVALLVAAAQLIPAADYTRDSVRSEKFEWRVASNWSSPPSRIFELVFPQIHRVLPTAEGRTRLSGMYDHRPEPFIADIYLGLLPSVLILAGVFSGQRGRWLILSVAALFWGIALGSHFFFYRILYSAGLGAARYPEKFLLGAMFLLLLWASILAEKMIVDRALRRTAIAFIVVYAALALLVTLADSPGGTSLPADLKPVSWKGYWLRAAVTAAGALALLAWQRRGTTVWVAGVLALTALDTYFVHERVAQRIERRFFEEPDVTASMREEKWTRRLFHGASWQEWDGNVPGPYFDGPEDWWPLRNGMFPYRPAAWLYSTALEQDLDQTGLLVHRRLVDAGTRARKVTGSWPPFILGASNVGHAGYFVPRSETPDQRSEYPVDWQSVSSPSLAYLAEEIVTSKSDDDFVRFMTTTHWNPKTVFADQRQERFSGGEVVLRRTRSSSLVLETNSLDAGMVVLSVTGHRYWSAKVNDRPAPIVPVNVAYQAVRIPAGKALVEFRYRNPWVYAGVAISLLTLVALGIWMRGSSSRNHS